MFKKSIKYSDRAKASFKKSKLFLDRKLETIFDYYFGKNDRLNARAYKYKLGELLVSAPATTDYRGRIVQPDKKMYFVGETPLPKNTKIRLELYAPFYPYNPNCYELVASKIPGDKGHLVLMKIFQKVDGKFIPAEHSVLPEIGRLR